MTTANHPGLPPVTLILLALRPGPLMTEQLIARGLRDAIDDARALGHVEACGMSGNQTLYRLTPAGRAACPKRRDLLGRAAADARVARGNADADQ